MPETHRYVSIEEAQNSTEWGNSYYGPIDNTRTFAAFVQTAWSQVNPYNNKVPQYYNNNGVTERCRVGCFAVALGQLMSYHKHPISYNWDLLISTPSISPYHTSAVNEVSRLLYDLALSGGTEYKLTGAGSTSVSKITPTLNSFGYNVTSTYLGTGQSSHISIEELKASRPVLFVPNQLEVDTYGLLMVSLNLNVGTIFLQGLCQQKVHLELRLDVSEQ